MKRPAIILLALLAVLVLGALSSLFTVGQTEQVLITQLGKPIRIITQPGLHAKLPFVQTAIPFDRRLLDAEIPPEEVILGDQRRLVVDSFTRYRITDPLQYYQTVGPSESGIRGRLDAVVSASMRRVLGREQLLDVLSAARTRIMNTIRNEVNQEMHGFGVTIVDVRIRRAALPAQNTQEILQRMQSERQRLAAAARAPGAAAAVRIRAQAARERTVLIAQARARAAVLRGEGEAQAIALSAAAYGQDPHFYAIWRTLDAYRAAFGLGHARLVLTPGHGFLKYLTTAPGTAP